MLLRCDVSTLCGHYYVTSQTVMEADIVVLFTGVVLVVFIVISCILLPSAVQSKTCNSWRASTDDAMLVDVDGAGSLTCQADAAGGIPKIIWTYWNTEQPEPFIKLCIDSWRWHNPEFEIRVVTPSTLCKYVNIDVKAISWNDSPARESDIVRLCIMERYGGVWSDASILLFGPYGFKHRMANEEFLGFYLGGFTTTDARYPVLESWFFASVQRGRFVTAWCKTFMDDSMGPTIDARLDTMRRLGVNMQNIKQLKYLYIHACAQYVMQKVLAPEETEKLASCLARAEDGPLKYLTDNGWLPDKAVQDLLRQPGKHSTIYKLRSCERPHVKDADIPALRDAVIRSVNR